MVMDSLLVVGCVFCHVETTWSSCDFVKEIPSSGDTTRPWSSWGDFHVLELVLLVLVVVVVVVVVVVTWFVAFVVVSVLAAMILNRG